MTIPVSREDATRWSDMKQRIAERHVAVQSANDTETFRRKVAALRDALIAADILAKEIETATRERALKELEQADVHA